MPHCTITTIAESSIDPGLLLVGTDDGTGVVGSGDGTGVGTPVGNGVPGRYSISDT